MIKGAGEKASAVAHRIYLCGFRRILMTDIPFPTAERRSVSFCEALHDGQKNIGGVAARRTEISAAAIEAAWSDGNIAVLADPAMQILENGSPAVFIDAVMAKQICSSPEICTCLR